MKSFVLVHGAWSDASSWQQTSTHLSHAGHLVASPNLPSHGTDQTPPGGVSIEDYVRTVIDAADHLGGPVVLVGHSMAGTVISLVAEQRPDLVTHLIYVAAFLLPSGKSLYGFTQSSPGMATSALGPALRPGDGVLVVDPDQFVNAFCADANVEVASSALCALRPEALAPLGTPITVTDKAWGSVPRSYIHTSEDRCVSPASQLEMVGAVGVGATRTITASHLVMLSQAAELAQAIIDLST
jgi:pimeloyl-ACP methyl ester carboxylesterase